jgi:hypothetical protein
MPFDPRNWDADEPPVDLKLFEGLPGAADRVLLYEGLPHQRMEWEVFRVERARPDTVELDGFPFYTDLLPLHPDHAAELTAVLSDPRSCKPYRGGKRCGGYHPDYALKWQFGASVVRAQVCLGCGEVKGFGPGGEVHCDVREDVHQRLRARLLPYRMNRPVVVHDYAEEARSEMAAALGLPLLASLSERNVDRGIWWTGSELQQVLDELARLEAHRELAGLAPEVADLAEWAGDLRAAVETAEQCRASVVVL